jgi:hypothetical protein
MHYKPTFKACLYSSHDSNLMSHLMTTASLHVNSFNRSTLLLANLSLITHLMIRMDLLNLSGPLFNMSLISYIILKYLKSEKKIQNIIINDNSARELKRGNLKV